MTLPRQRVWLDAIRADTEIDELYRQLAAEYRLPEHERPLDEDSAMLDLMERLHEHMAHFGLIEADWAERVLFWLAVESYGIARVQHWHDVAARS